MKDLNILKVSPLIVEASKSKPDTTLVRAWSRLYPEEIAEVDTR